MIPFPNKRYSVIYADPPWKYQDERCEGTAADHYPTMRIEDICNLPVQDLAADNCVLFLWATYPKLKEALQVIEAWGFKYRSIGFQWIKQNRSGKGYFFGLGRWTRGNTEPCLDWQKKKCFYSSQLYYENNGYEIVSPIFQLNEYGKYEAITQSNAE